MAYSAGKIEWPVGIYDVQRALGSSSPDVATLCINENINKWARYKPERAAGPKPLIHGTTVGQTRTRKTNAFGLSVPFCQLDIMNALVYAIFDDPYNNKCWEYLQPRGDRTPQGGVEEYYRLSDFARIPTDDSDPFYGTAQAKGYNHYAKMPFEALLNVAGIDEQEDSDGRYFVVNVQTVNRLVFTFQNSVGDDLHLQDFIDIQDYGSGKAWRPVLQVFNGYKPAGGQDWWEKSQADVEVAGDAITNVDGASWEVELPVNTGYFTPYINVNNFFHLCVGVGCCNQTPPLTWKDNNESLFILPYNQADAEAYELPFYYRFKLVSYQARRLAVTELQFYADGIVQWVVAGGTPPYFDIHSLATGAVRLTMTINKLPSQKVDFIPQNGTPDSGYDPMKIQAREMITGVQGENIIYLTPTDSSWSPASHTHIEQGQTSDTQTIYATMFIGNIPVGGYGEYHLYANTGGQNWDNIGYFRVRKIQYTN